MDQTCKGDLHLHWSKLNPIDLELHIGCSNLDRRRDPPPPIRQMLMRSTVPDDCNWKPTADANDLDEWYSEFKTVGSARTSGRQ